MNEKNNGLMELFSCDKNVSKNYQQKKCNAEDKFQSHSLPGVRIILPTAQTLLWSQIVKIEIKINFIDSVWFPVLFVDTKSPIDVTSYYLWHIYTLILIEFNLIEWQSDERQ